MVDKVRIDITARTIKVADRGAKVKGGRGGARGDGGGNGVAGEEPYFHEVGSPLHGVHTTAIGIEAIAVAGLIVASCCAASCSSSTDSAVIAICPTGLVLKFHGAVRGGVGGDLVGGECVDAFDDVELAVSGPVGVSESPEGWPYSADGAGHVFDVCEEETVVVVDIAFEAY